MQNKDDILWEPPPGGDLIPPGGDLAIIADSSSAKPHSSNLRKGRVSLPGHFYFTRKSVSNQQDTNLAESEIAEIIIERFLFAKKHKWLKITAFVIMPDHYHLLLRLGKAISLSDIFSRMSSFATREIHSVSGKSGDIWQKSFYDHLVRKTERLPKIVSYIHLNPVRAGLVKNPEEWPYSTANARFKDEMEWE
ncbi:MAG: REP-associated tyrosine transposase [Planctomycetota bacterium]|jgi:REP element-mobilizing transposase RayT